MTLPQNIINKILGSHPKKDFNVKNNRTKRGRPRKSDSCADTSDTDAKQGLAKESEKED